MMADPDQPSFHIPPPPFATDPAVAPALARLFGALPGARLVGGCVRDALAGRPVADLDLATPWPPDEVMRAVAAAGLRAVPTGLAHGTVTAVAGGHGFEVTTLRRDERTDGRHADVAWTGDWREDAARRDFTINALSLRPAPDGGAWGVVDWSVVDWDVFDYFGGADDLRAGLVRFVGDAKARVAEDYLRILRFFRFHARYGSGAADAEALAAIRDGVPGLARLSAERVWSELKRILATPDPRGAVALMAETGVLAAVLPDGADPAALARLVAAGAPADPVLRVAALHPGDPAPLAARMKLSTAERDRLAALHAAPVPAPDFDDPALRRLAADWPPPVLLDRAWLAGGDRPGWDALRARIGTMKRPRFPLEGRDALALGVPPGPTVGALLRDLRSWWMDGGCVADAAACRAELSRRLAA